MREVHSFPSTISTKKYGYINFDDGRLIGVKSENLNDFLEVLNEIEPNPEYLLIDEIQNIAGKPDYEVDFLIKEGSKIVQLIQVSFSISNVETKKREIKSLLKASEKLKCNDLVVITQDEEGEEKIKSKLVKIIPVWKWLLVNG